MRLRQSNCYTENIEAGLTEPPSLHPEINPTICMGAGTCISACPEGAIGMIKGKAVLINPTHCIGHGVCAVACPHDAIKLVFGTAKRGMDIPVVKPNFETNVPGIFIAGELGGMGLIRKAATQGVQAMESIAKLKGGSNPYDVVIIGTGPAGLGATLSAVEKKMRYVTLEQEESTRWRHLPIPAQQDRHDCAGETAYRRERTVQGSQQGKTA